MGISLLMEVRIDCSDVTWGSSGGWLLVSCDGVGGLWNQINEDMVMPSS